MHGRAASVNITKYASKSRLSLCVRYYLACTMDSANNIHYVAVARMTDDALLLSSTFTEAKQFPRGLYEDKVRKLIESGRVERQSRLTIADKDIGNLHYHADPVFLVLCKFGNAL